MVIYGGHHRNESLGFRQEQDMVGEGQQAEPKVMVCGMWDAPRATVGPSGG